LADDVLTQNQTAIQQQTGSFSHVSWAMPFSLVLLAQAFPGASSIHEG
jgi:hypothetical protein